SAYEPGDPTAGPEIPEPSIDRELERRMTTSMAVIAALILGGIVSSSYREWTRYRDAHAIASRSRDTLESVNKLTAHLLDAETGQRGFLLTGDVRYLEPYHQSVQLIPFNVGDLGRLLASRPNDQSRIRHLEALVDQKLAELHRTISLRTAQGPHPAL